MEAYKLLRLRKDGTIGSLFIGQKARLPLGKWLQAELITTKGYYPRQGWHCTAKPEAPHLSMKGRIWARVEVADYYHFPRPPNQGGTWIIAQRMKIQELLPLQEVDNGRT